VTRHRFLAPLAWTGVIAWMSGSQWSAAGTSFLVPVLHALLPWASPDQLQAGHWLIRKLAHLTEYAILAGLWRWAMAARVSAAWRPALALAAITAVLDELHQATTTTRTGSAQDVLLDCTGAAAALALLAGGRRAVDGLIGALLWTAAAGGAALVTLNVAVDAPSGWLWATVPAAAVALFFWRRRRGGA